MHLIVVPWNRLIVDSVDFDANPKIEVLELTESQLRQHPNYDQSGVSGLLAAKSQRKTIDSRRKDNKTGYHRLYEVHGVFSRATEKIMKGEKPAEGDDKIFYNQMYVISFVGDRTNGKLSYKDFVLFANAEDDPYMITHLIPEDGRTLAIGAVEHLFEAQFMQNHTVKRIKDQLDLASLLMFQTADKRFLNMNVLSSVETGYVFVHDPNKPIEPVPNNSHDTGSLDGFRAAWKAVGNEIVGISEAMLGADPKSGTAWRQTEALLRESHSLFEKMTENKGLYLIDMMRRWILLYIKTKLDTSDEITAILESYQITQIDEMFIPNKAVRNFNTRTRKEIVAGRRAPAFDQEREEQALRAGFANLGNQRFFKPSDVNKKTWKKMLEGFVWDLEVDITQEGQMVQEAMTTLNSALKIVVTPEYKENAEAQAIVGRVLELSGGMSPVELNAIQSKNRSRNKQVDPARNPLPDIKQPATDGVQS